MQTEQPTAVRTRLFTAEDVAKKRLRKVVEGEIPNERVATALNLWVEYKGWLDIESIPLESIIRIRADWTGFEISQIAYRWGYQKRMLPPEQWIPGWGRRPRKAVKSSEAPRPDGDRPLPHGVEGSLHTLEESVAHLLRREKDRDQLSDDFRQHQRVATPATELSGRVGVMDREIVRLAGIIELERTASTDLLERIVKIENKLKGGGRRGPTLPTKLHRELRRRLRILIAGGK